MNNNITPHLLNPWIVPALTLIHFSFFLLFTILFVKTSMSAISAKAKKQEYHPKKLTIILMIISLIISTLIFILFRMARWFSLQYVTSF